MNLTTTTPRTGESRELTFGRTPAADVAGIVAGANKGAALLRTKTREERAQLLELIAQRIEDNRATLIAAADYETALGEARLNGELTRTCYQLKEFAQVVRKGILLESIIDRPSDSEMGPRPDLRRAMVPLGTVAVFGASNFPFAFSVCGGDTASAIAAGNTVVVKAHSSHLETSYETFKCMQQAFVESGFEADAVGIVFGQEAARELVNDPNIDAVGFTGSVHGGRMLFDIAQARPTPIPFYGELGSVNPLIVTEATAKERGRAVAEGYVNSIVLGSGQFCTKPGVIFVPKNNSEELRSTLSELLQETDTKWLLNKSTFESYQTETAALAENPVFFQIDQSQNNEGEGFSVKPKVFWAKLEDIAKQTEVLFTECFGPMAIAVEYESLADVEAQLADMPGALAAAIHAEESDVPQLGNLVSTLTRRAGRILWNAYPTGVSVSWAQTHGGPYPSSTSSLHTSVGATAIRRFLRPVTYQSFPQGLLPEELRDDVAFSTPYTRVEDTESVTI